MATNKTKKEKRPTRLILEDTIYRAIKQCQKAINEEPEGSTHPKKQRLCNKLYHLIEAYN